MVSNKIAAILNFLFWGLGYLYLRKFDYWIGVGALLAIAYVLAHLPILFLGLEFFLTEPAGMTGLLSRLLISIALAYDVYKR